MGRGNYTAARTHLLSIQPMTGLRTLLRCASWWRTRTTASSQTAAAVSRYRMSLGHDAGGHPLRAGPGEVYGQVAPVSARTTLLVKGLSADENWWVIQNPQNLDETCWVPNSQVVIWGDISGVQVVEAPPAPSGAPAANPSVGITGVTVDSQNRYMVEFVTQNFTRKFRARTSISSSTPFHRTRWDWGQWRSLDVWWLVTIHRIHRGRSTGAGYTDVCGGCQPRSFGHLREWQLLRSSCYAVTPNVPLKVPGAGRISRTGTLMDI